MKVYIVNSTAIKFPITFIIALLTGLGFLIVFPVISKNPLFLLILPLAEIFFLFLLIKPKEMLAGILLVRPALDLVLEHTKITVHGVAFGAGAGLNLTVIFLAILFKFSNPGHFKLNVIIKWWILYLFLLFISVCHSPFKGTGIHSLIDNMTYFAMLIIPLLIVKTQDDFKYWIKIIAASFILPVIVGNIDLFVWHGQYFPDSGQRIAGSFAHPNILAFFISFGLTFYFYFLNSKLFKLSQIKLYIIMAFMLNMLILLFATKTRNAWIACFIGFVIYGFLNDKKFLLILLFITPFSLLIPSIHQRVINVFDSSTAVDVNYQGINSYQWRIEMWKSCIPMILQKPLQGYGLTSFKPMSADFSTVGENGAHNVYLELCFETGIFGFLAYVLIFLSLLKIFWKRIVKWSDSQNSKLAAIVFGYILSYMIICSADNLMYYLAFNWYVWFFLGLLLKQMEIERAKVSV